MWIRKIGLLLALILIAQVNFAQNLELKAQLSKNRILVGDTLSLWLSVEVDKNSEIVFPIIFDTIAQGVEIVGEPKLDSIVGIDSKKYIKQFTISAYDSAMYVFGGLAAVDISRDIPDTIYSNDLTLFVDYQDLNNELETKIDTALKEKIIANKANIETPFSFAEFWILTKEFLKKYWYFVLALIIIILFVLYWYYRIRKRKIDLSIKPIIKIKPHIEALDNLDTLTEKKLWQQGKTKDYYSELSEILRLYMERRFNIIALETTTEIIRTQLRYYKHTSTELEEDIHSLLQLSDYVKFAKYKALPAENEKSLMRAYGFVQATKPEEIRVTDIKTENTEQI